MASIQRGSHLGPYQVLEPIGAGGMGEVYKARDTRLDRVVAIKVLPAHLSSAPELRDRFEREARTISSLNHPNICTLHDIGRHEGIDFLVMEYLEGETLAQRLAKGTMPLDQALKCAIEIAGALDKAHRQGVIHRDLKPGNIMLTKTGAKLLDFGLAKLKQSPEPVTGFSARATAAGSADLTAHGTILGTLQYMSPEQLESREADARSDIFAFGAVLYEMLTGRKAFEGRSQSSIIAAIMHVDPPGILVLKPMSPPALDRIVKVCLAKDPDERWQTAHDLALQLRWAGEAESQPSVAASVRTPRIWLAATMVSVLIALASAALLVYERRSPAEAPVVRFTVGPPDKTVFEAGGELGLITTNGSGLSPDGRKLAFTARDQSGKILLWVRSLDGLAAKPLPGTDNANQPFWSPDSRSIAFAADGRLKKIDVEGGALQTLCECSGGFHGGAWGRSGVILFAAGPNVPLNRVSSAGGEVTPATKVVSPQPGHRFPSFLPDGRHFLYFAGGAGTEGVVSIGSLDSLEGQRLLTADSPALYAAPGYVLFIRQGTLFAQPFDSSKLKLTGEPVPIAEQVAFDGPHRGFSVSENGVLAYRTGGGSNNIQLAWIDRKGKLIEAVGTPGGYLGPDISPDGTRIAVHRHEGAGGDVWLVDTSGLKTSRFTFDASQENSQPIWSPDGSRIAFGSRRSGKWGIYLKPSNGIGSEEILVEPSFARMPMSWSADGKFILFWVLDPKTGSDAWALPLAGDRKPFPVLQTAFGEANPQISPDGRWLSYTSNESSQNEIYVQSFPPGLGKWQISTSGGAYPRWRRDGKELFYFEAPQGGGRVFSVQINASGSKFEFSAPQPLFESGFTNFGFGHGVLQWNAFAVSADGQRFLIPRAESNVGGVAAATPITIVQNWTGALRKK